MCIRDRDISDESAAVEQFFLSARDALKSNVVGYYRLAGVDIIYRSEDGSHRNDRQESYTSQASNKNELYDAIAWQPEGEKEAQTTAYDFVSSLDKELFGEGQSFYTSDNLKELMEERGLEESWNKQIFLSHFGIKEGALYIGVEMCIRDRSMSHSCFFPPSSISPAAIWPISSGAPGGPRPGFWLRS